MSIRKMLITSRKSGPALVYVTEPDGSRTITDVRPARSPHKSRPLTREEVLCILTQTGEVPETFIAPGYCGVQANDNHGFETSPLTLAMRASGIMDGYIDPTGQRGRRLDGSLGRLKTLTD